MSFNGKSQSDLLDLFWNGPISESRNLINCIAFKQTDSDMPELVPVTETDETDSDMPELVPVTETDDTDSDMPELIPVTETDDTGEDTNLRFIGQERRHTGMYCHFHEARALETWYIYEDKNSNVIETKTQLHSGKT